MQEKIFCPKCSRRIWCEIKKIEIGSRENKIIVTCPKCKAVITKVIKK